MGHSVIRRTLRRGSQSLLVFAVQVVPNSMAISDHPKTFRLISTILLNVVKEHTQLLLCPLSDCRISTCNAQHCACCEVEERHGVLP